MTDPAAQPSTGTSGSQAPGERRLPHPPSDRYRTPDVEAPNTTEATSVARALAYALVAAMVGAGATTILGGVLAVSAGLLMVAAATGWVVAIALRVGGGSHLDPGRRGRLALVLTAVAVVLGQLGLWLFARSEGGVLGPVDYLAETFGLLIPLQLAIAWIVAAVTAR